MKTYPYNRTSIEGRRLFRLLDVQFNPGVLDAKHEGKTFESYEVPSVMQCRANKTRFLFSSNHSGIKRPLVHVEADIEMAFGDFADNITTLDFTHGGQELPLTYVQPIEDDTMKMLIDAGLYRDERFEELISKLMQDEVFDAEADMNVLYLDIGDESKNERIPVLLVDPVNVVHEQQDPSEYTTIQNLLKRSAKLAIELRKEGVRTEELVRDETYEQDREIFIAEQFEDVVAKHTEQQKDDPTKFVASSELLDREIDVTEELKGSLGFDHTTEDDKIRELKEREREDTGRLDVDDTYSSYREVAVANSKPKTEHRRFEDEGESIKDKQFGAFADISELDEKVEPVKTKSEPVLDFDKGLDDYEFEAEDDGPEL